MNTLGAPHGFAVDAENQIFICDMAHQAILILGGDGKVVEYVRNCESKIFRGPNSIIMEKNGETLDSFFTDSGLIGESMEIGALGSLFWIQGGEFLQPIDLEVLKSPYGLCLSDQTGSLYVAELQENRILRYVRGRGKSGWIRSTWFQLNGRMGPSALAYANGYIFIAHYDIRESGTSNGKIIIVDERDCSVIDEIVIENGCEITCLYVSSDKQTLYVCESVTKSIFKIDISSLPIFEDEE